MSDPSYSKRSGCTPNGSPSSVHWIKGIRILCHVSSHIEWEGNQSHRFRALFRLVLWFRTTYSGFEYEDWKNPYKISSLKFNNPHIPKPPYLLVDVDDETCRATTDCWSECRWKSLHHFTAFLQRVQHLQQRGVVTGLLSVLRTAHQIGLMFDGNWLLYGR